MTTEPLAPVPDDPAPHRRVAVLPLALAAAALLVAVVFIVVIVNLAMSGPPVAAPPPVGESTSAPPAPTQPAAPAPDERRAAEVNECVDALDDGTVDIDSARVAIDGGRLTTSVQLVSALPAGEVTVGIYAVSGSGDAIFQFASTWRDGQLRDFFAQRYGVGDGDNKPGRGDDSGRGNGNDDDDHDSDDDNGGESDGFEVDDLDTDDVEVDGTTVVAHLPRSVVRELGENWRWYAFTAVDGLEVDACPGAVQTFETQPFER